MRRMKSVSRALRPVAFLLALVAAAPTARAEVMFDVYFGDAWTTKTDLSLQQPGGTDLTFRDVGWTSSLRSTAHFPSKRDAGTTRMAAACLARR